MVFGKFKNYYILRYIIYDFLKKVSGGNRPTCLVRVHCAVGHSGVRGGKRVVSKVATHDITRRFFYKSNTFLAPRIPP